MFTGLLIFFLILSLVIFIHELGHMLAAKSSGVLVEEFGLGLPPRAVTLFKKGETEYTLNWLPIGGFVRLYGENGEMNAEIPDKRAFWAQPIWRRATILLAGVFMNFVLGTVLFGAVYTYLGIPTASEEVLIAGLETGSPAEVAGVKLEDRLLRLEINGEQLEVTSSETAVTWLYQYAGEDVLVTVVREGEEIQLPVSLRLDPDRTQGVLGVVLDDTQLVHYPLWQMPFRGMWFGLREALAWGREILNGLGDLVISLVVGRRVPEGLAGPVGIYNISRQAAEQGIIVLLRFVGVLSINLAILNALPIPALDGGRLVFLAIEAVTRRKVAVRLESYVNTAGMILLLTFMAVITFNDLANLGLGQAILGWFGR
jgi:regulator of sigma E protease